MAIIRTMDVDYVYFEKIKNDILVTAGHYIDGNEKDVLKFTFNTSKINLEEYEESGQRISNYKNEKIRINKNEYIEYNFRESSVRFKLLNLNIKLIQRFAPECLRENLSEFL